MTAPYFFFKMVYCIEQKRTEQKGCIEKRKRKKKKPKNNIEQEKNRPPKTPKRKKKQPQQLRGNQVPPIEQNVLPLHLTLIY